MRFVLFLCSLLLVSAVVQAQGFRSTNGRNHPELDWQVAETAHFRIAYPAHLSGIEVEAAAIAEASYAALSANLGVTFDRKIRLYLSDEDEIANGFAMPLGNGISNIWVHANDVAAQWTGREKWLRKVIAHELAHIFHYRAVRSRIGLLGYLVARPVPPRRPLAPHSRPGRPARLQGRYLHLERTAALRGRERAGALLRRAVRRLDPRPPLPPAQTPALRPGAGARLPPRLPGHYRPVVPGVLRRLAPTRQRALQHAREPDGDGRLARRRAARPARPVHLRRRRQPRRQPDGRGGAGLDRPAHPSTLRRRCGRLDAGAPGGSRRRPPDPGELESGRPAHRLRAPRARRRRRARV